MNKMTKIRILILLCLLVAFLYMSYSAFGASVVGSKHDISSSLGDPYSDQPCAFCHTPHSANLSIGAPLWNRSIGSVTFTAYTSPTMNTVCSSPPSGISLACLGCHDGVDASNDKHQLVNAPGPGGIPDTTSWPNCDRCHPEFNNGQAIEWIGTDLRTSHPISNSYPTLAQDPDFYTPPDLQIGWPGISNVKLYGGKVECPSCHNVHDNAIVPFLRKSNSSSALCTTCHKK